jgi:hypothetical protein
MTALGLKELGLQYVDGRDCAPFNVRSPIFLQAQPVHAIAIKNLGSG